MRAWEAWREGLHDDLVLSGALAVWRGETTPPPMAPYWHNIGR